MSDILRLTSEIDIANEVSKERVETAVVQTADGIVYPCLVIRADKQSMRVTEVAIEGLLDLIHSCWYTDEDRESGLKDDSLNVYIATPSGAGKLGRGSFAKLYRYLNSFTHNLISEAASVYYFEAEGKKERIDKLNAMRPRVWLDL